MIPALLIPPLTVLLFFFGMYILALLRHDNSIADVAWGIGFILMAVGGMITHEQYGFRAIVVIGLVTIWGVRLAFHIFRRNQGKGEDFRYQQWRREWGDHAWIKSFVYVFLLQWLMLVIVSLPIQIIMGFGDGPIGIFDLIGISVWLIGILFESIGDHQLAVFKSNPENKGKILQSGLWQFTRHPNYFGEALLWWGIALIAVKLPYGTVGLLGAATITYLLRFVSGVPLLEKKYAGRSDFEAYKAKTSAFLPWFPMTGR